MKTLIIGDVHGRAAELQNLIDTHRVEEDVTSIVQLGDLCNCVSTSGAGDLECMRIAEEFIGTLLVGNHEYPMIVGTGRDLGTFFGYEENPEVTQLYRRWYFNGHIKAATTVGEYLVTHAGIGREFTKTMTFMPHLASRYHKDISLMLNHIWQESPKHPIFSQIGHRRGGSSTNGGILWADWREPKDRAIKQIVGHTHSHHTDDIRRRVNATCIDYHPIGHIVIEHEEN